MNKTIFLFSLTLIIVTHLWALSYTYIKEIPKITKPKPQKVTLQMAKLVEPVPVVEKKVIEKPIVKKEVFKKPIKKEAKRKLVKKKVIKKPKKKVVKKKIIKKKVIKKKPIKKPVVEPVEKILPVIEAKKIVKPKEVAKPAKKVQTQSLVNTKVFKDNYKTALRAAINKKKRYPSVSRRLREQGRVVVGFTISKSGVISNTRIVESSGKKRLDKAALKALNKVGKFKSFPKEIKESSLQLTLPMQFKLK